MAREQLLGLTIDLDRLLAAGAAAAIDNDTLVRPATMLRGLGPKVPALVPIADKLDLLTGASPDKVGPAFLDALLMARQLRAGLATHGIDGPLQPIAESGTWQTPLPLSELQRLCDLLHGLGNNREEELGKAWEAGMLGDLRLLPALLKAVADRNAGVANFIAEEVLPALGRGILPDVLSALDLKGGSANPRRLWLVCRLDPGTAAPLCRRALVEGDLGMCLTALRCLPDVLPGEAERAGLHHATHPNSVVRRAGLGALRRGSSDAAMEALFAAQADRSDEVRQAAVTALATFAHPDTTRRLLHALHETRTALTEATDPPGPAKKSKTRTKQPKATPEQARLLRKLSWLALALGGRLDHDADSAAALLSLAREDISMVRCAALEALGGVGPVSDEVTEALLEGVKKTGYERIAALKGLERFPPEARAEAVPVALKLARDGKQPHDVRKAALAMLPGNEERFTEEIVDGLDVLGHATDWQTRRLVADTLTAIGPAGLPLVPGLLKAAEASPTLPSFATITVLPDLDPEGTTAIPGLLEFLEGRRQLLRRAALLALTRYGPKARAAASAIAAPVDIDDDYGRALVKRCLDAIDC
jgi:HEAT repeat protein